MTRSHHVPVHELEYTRVHAHAVSGCWAFPAAVRTGCATAQQLTRLRANQSNAINQPSRFPSPAHVMSSPNSGGGFKCMTSGVRFASRRRLFCTTDSACSAIAQLPHIWCPRRFARSPPPLVQLLARRCNRRSTGKQPQSAASHVVDVCARGSPTTATTHGATHPACQPRAAGSRAVTGTAQV